MYGGMYCRIPGSIELVLGTTHGGYTGASADNVMAVTYSGYMIFPKYKPFSALHLREQREPEEKMRLLGRHGRLLQYCRIRKPLGGPRLSPGPTSRFM